MISHSAENDPSQLIDDGYWAETLVLKFEEIKVTSQSWDLESEATALHLPLSLAISLLQPYFILLTKK